ncbi:MAG: 16S rRNA (guanine(527)-N(7))-methyltransferase RsmG [Desulfotignum sp.]|nr:16S rRNA (guanine(527)-N(7))-methyltransferase RsmG [Desulfotignum sp.]
MSGSWMEVFCDTLSRGSVQMGFDLTPVQVEQMACHAVQLEKWNQHVNLTAIKGPADLAHKHFLDAVAIQPYFRGKSGRWMDMGTGGGFPGLPVKLLNPGIHMVLVDASRKKIHFLKHVIRMLKIDGIEAIHGRVDALHHDPGFVGRFEGILARGVAGLDRLAGLAAPLLAQQGLLYALKSPGAREEITDDLDKNFFIQWDDYELPDGKETRSLVRLTVKQKSS